jgi:bacterioferritin-associated ferredoxin
MTKKAEKHKQSLEEIKFQTGLGGGCKDCQL